MQEINHIMKYNNSYINLIMGKTQNLMKKIKAKKYIIILGLVLFIGVAVALVKFVIPNLSSSNASLDDTGVSINTTKLIDDLTTRTADFTLDSSAYSAEAMTTISNFEETDNVLMQGSGSYDTKVFYEGVRSMSLISTERKSVSATLVQKFNLNKMQYIEFMLNVSDTEAFEKISIDFGDLALKIYNTYTLTNVKTGWNLIRIPRDQFALVAGKDVDSSNIQDWSRIEKIRISALSRPQSIFYIRVDMLRSINGFEEFLTQWNVTDSKSFLSLFEKDGKAGLMARNIVSSVATVKEIDKVGDFMFVATVSPQSAGRSGLFVHGDYKTGYGYYILLGGEKKNTWQILKRNKAGWSSKELIVTGILDNTTFSSDSKYWIRVLSSGETLECYFSSNGKNYEKLGEFKDNEFNEGSVGIAVLDAGRSLFDDFSLTKF
jgi:hypothetical protein